MDDLTDLSLLPLAPMPLPPEAHIRVHRDAFLAHGRSARLMAAEPRLGVSIPWVLVSCGCIEGTVEGIIVHGDWDDDDKGWVFDSTFTVFDAHDGPGGSFTRVHGWMFCEDGIEVLGQMPGDAP